MKGYDNIFDLKTQIYSLSESRIFADDTDYADFTIKSESPFTLVA